MSALQGLASEATVSWHSSQIRVDVMQVQKMHEAQETSASEVRSAKRRKTSPEVPAAKKKPAISKSTWYTLIRILFPSSCSWSSPDASACGCAVVLTHVTDLGFVSLVSSTVPCPQHNKGLLGISFVYVHFKKLFWENHQKEGHRFRIVIADVMWCMCSSDALVQSAPSKNISWGMQGSLAEVWQ